MADEGGEKTEMPTPKKLRDGRKKGQVCTSKDVVSTCLLVVLMGVLAFMGIMLTDDLSELLRFVGSRTGSPETGVGEASFATLVITCKHTFLFVLVAMATAIAANMCQIGFLFAIESIKPDMKKINPAEGFKKIFCKKNFFEFLKNCVKVTFLGYLIYRLVLESIPALLPICYGTTDDIFPILKMLLKNLAGYTAFGYVVIAVVDRLVQQRLFLKQMMMTKDEVKREYKEMEGSQEIKQAQREFRDEILNGPDPRTGTKKASVVVTNPTHYAVGVRFDPSEAPLPRVVSSGADRIAKIIRDVAMQEGIPMMENVPLARALYAKVRVDDFIPVELAEPVAEVLKWVKQLNEAKREDEELDSVELD